MKARRMGFPSRTWSGSMRTSWTLCDSEELSLLPVHSRQCEAGIVESRIESDRGLVLIPSAGRVSLLLEDHSEPVARIGLGRRRIVAARANVSAQRHVTLRESIAGERSRLAS